MPSSEGLNDVQRSRIEGVVREAVEDAGPKGLIIKSDGSSIHDLIDALPEICHRYFIGRDEKFDGFKQVLREMENDGTLVAKDAPQGRERDKTLVLARYANEVQASSMSSSRSRSHPETPVRATHDITNPAAAAA